MKYFLLITILSCLFIKASAQKDTLVVQQYCIAIIHNKPLKGSFEVSIDYGDTLNTLQVLKDERGKPINFSTIVQFFNYMGKQGWRMISKDFSDGGKPGYLFRRKNDMRRLYH